MRVKVKSNYTCWNGAELYIGLYTGFYADLDLL
jgi:hypothetical protein